MLNDISSKYQPPSTKHTPINNTNFLKQK